MNDIAIKIENLKKQYKLGTIGGQTLSNELQSWWARKRGKEDPNLKIGEDYSKCGQNFLALDDINLEIKKGEAVGIIGGNGAGKSTLLKILSRVTAPTEGDVWINGRIASMLEVGTGFHAELTGRENIYMNGAILGMSKKEVDEKIESIIDFSECRQFIDTPVKRYSSGMYVKLAFAVASHLDAEIMVMDEVLAVGDMKFQKKCLGKMDDEAKGGKTILYVSHNMATVRSLCTRCVVLSHGKMVYDGDVEKAIDIYLGDVKGDLCTKYDFSQYNRSGYERRNTIELLSFWFREKSIAKFETNELIKFCIRWKANENFSNVRIRFVIVRADGNAVGMACSEPVLSGQKGKIYESSFSYDASNLSIGVYSFHVIAFETNEYGTISDYDKPNCRMFFEIYNDGAPSIQWSNQWWGNVRLNTFMHEKTLVIDEGVHQSE